MQNLFVSFIAVIVTMLTIVALRPIARATGLMDKPDKRKTHTGDIPLVGGIAIYLAVATSTLIGLWFSGRAEAAGSGAAVFLFAALLLVIVGIWDDFRALTPLVRIVAQVCATLIMIFAGGVLITDLGAISFSGALVQLGPWSVPFTIFATVGVINAINMADGLDGLVGNITLVSLLGLGAATTLWGEVPIAAMINILSAAVIGFLFFNQRLFWRDRAVVFLGDAGSTMLGFALAWTAIAVSQGPERAISPAAALWFVAVPVCDTLNVMVRRLLEGRSPFRADSRHLHHLFVKAGFSVNETLLFMCGLAIGGVTVGLAATWYQVPEWLLIIGFVGVWLACLQLSRRAWRRQRFLGRNFTDADPAVD